ncbi:MAG: cation transporter [Pseudomonadota bacterium]|nr:cation transporter [Pseudomonadota bacterium]MDE3037148.1 cation transporter [Pseudomonadota bacterium]
MNHNHSHDHDHHGHSHDHSHTPTSFGKAFAIGISLNTLFIVAEVIYGLKANSLALVADAGHNLSDVLGLFMAWGATYLAKRQPTHRYTYGLQSSSIVAALANAVMLLFVTGGICWEAIQRFHKPEDVAGTTVMAVAAFGIFVNGFSAWLFMKGSKDDLNIKGAFLHMLGDAAISAGVVVSGFVILQTGWHWLDAAVSIAVSMAIIYGTWGLLRDSMNLTLHAVPAHIDYAEVKDFLTNSQGVKEVHDLHIWAMSTTEVALSAHLLMQGGHPGDHFLKHLSHELQEHFRISHATIQIEMGDAECALAPENVV